MMWIRRVALVLAVLMVATGCGDDTDNPPTTEDPTGTTDGESGIGGSNPPTTEGESEDDDDITQTPDPGPEPPDGDTEQVGTELNGTDWSAASPEEIILLLFGSPDGTKSGIQEHFEEMEHQTELAISECMKEEGFEYTPQKGLEDTLDAMFEFELDSREYAEEYGLGITTTDLISLTAGGREVAINDPNQEYFESLSDTEQLAYEDALNGIIANSDSMIDEEEDSMIDDEEDPSSIPSEEVPGCREKAYVTAESYSSTVQFPNFDRVFEVFVAELNQVNQDIVADQRYLDLMTDWSDCMADKGHSYAEINELFDDVMLRQQDLMASIPDPFEGLSESEIEELEPEEISALLDAAQPNDDQMTELQEYEISVAVDSWDCGMYDQEAVATEIFNDHVGVFVSDNLDEIRSLLIEE